MIKIKNIKSVKKSLEDVKYRNFAHYCNLIFFMERLLPI